MNEAWRPEESRQKRASIRWRTVVAGESGGQTMPDSIVGNLIHFRAATPSSNWQDQSLGAGQLIGPRQVRQNEWLFMAYHAFDFFFAH